MDSDKKELREIRHIHLIGICGTAMGAVALMLKELGYHVTGSDQNVYPPMSDFLIQRGVNIFKGYSSDNLNPLPDLVIVGNAVTRKNEEVVAMNALKLAYCSMPEAVNRFIAEGKKQIVVTGTHGKTTTSSLIAWLLYTAGLDPSFLIGGIVSEFNSNYRIGTGDYIVIEGDEYDTAYFDKGAKFLHYRPDIAIITSIEFDHADIFTDLEGIVGAFGKLIGNFKEGTTLVAADDCAEIDGLTQNPSYELLRYGKKHTSSIRLEQITIDPPYTCCTVILDQKKSLSFRTKMKGEHNLFNLMAAIGVARTLHLSESAVKDAFESFKGVKRRQEVRGIKNGITVVDDFAHHPTAVRETIRAVRSHMTKGRLIAVFEPRTNTSMRNVFQNDYPAAFDGADLICIRKPPLLEKIPEDLRFSSEKLVADIVMRGKDAHFFSDTDEIIFFLKENAKDKDTVLVMSNGGFENIHQRLLDLL